MTWLALLFLGLGAADLAQAVAGPRRRWIGALAGASTIGVTAALALAPTLPNALAASACLLALGAWRATHAAHPRGRTQALLGLLAAAGPVAVGVACSGLAPPASGPLADWLRSIPLLGLPTAGPDRALLLLGAALVNVETANLIVRDTLVATGTSPLTRGHSDGEPALLGPRRLRGGRALGAMERLLILGFGASGNLAAAGLVVAAKGLIRFPELNAASKGSPASPRIDEITEYFLIGSFASILVALGTVALTA
nr:hypothetical protein [Propionibacterium sp.]